MTIWIRLENINLWFITLFTLNLDQPMIKSYKENRVKLLKQSAAKRLKPQIINPHSHTQPNALPLPLKLPFKMDLHGFMHE